MLRSRFSHGVARVIGILAGVAFFIAEAYLFDVLRRHGIFRIYSHSTLWLIGSFVAPWLAYHLVCAWCSSLGPCPSGCGRMVSCNAGHRSEEHTSELQSHLNLVCRLLLEKKKTSSTYIHSVIITPQLADCIYNT